jgi:peptidoglycan/xylan/chitin deacetylase (PgdA/CDA1 family)
MPRIVSLLFHDVYQHDPSESGFSSAAADRYKLTSAEFDAQIRGLAGVAPSRSVTDLLDSGAAGRSGGFAITVDDGGMSFYTDIAPRLEALGWHGACFVSTDFIGQRGFLDRDRIRELDRRGHLIGSHSASHPTRFSACSADRMREEWRKSREVLEDVLGRAVDVASLPGGYFSTAVARTAAEAGYRLLFTSTPATTLRRIDGCVIAGRFTIRHGSRADTARSFVLPAPWARGAAWAAWNAKGLIKPLLGASYPRVADWLLAVKQG